MHGILLLSDIHAGAHDVNSLTMPTRAKIFLRGLEQALSGEWPEHWALVLGGDLVEGENIYPRQSWDVEDDVNRHVWLAVDLIEVVLDRLLERSTVSLYAVEGNHGRNSKHSYGNWDRMVAEIVVDHYENRLNHAVIAERRSPVQFQAGGLTWLAWHGDGIRMYMNIPFYGIWRRVLAWSQTMEFDGVLLGHFHSLHYYRAGAKHVFLNGAWHESQVYGFEKGLVPSLDQWCILVEDGRILRMCPLPTN